MSGVVDWLGLIAVAVLFIGLAAFTIACTVVSCMWVWSLRPGVRSLDQKVRQARYR